MICSQMRGYLSGTPVKLAPYSLGLRDGRQGQLAVRAQSSRTSWLPGTELPQHLDGSLPGDFGFDPLRLGENPEALKWYQQAELQNGRWAMLGVFGILFHNLLGKLGLGGPAATTTTWFNAGKFDYGVDNRTLLAIEFFLFAWVELRRYQDLKKPGATNQDPIFKNQSLPQGNEPGYPGGIFDPFGLSKGDGGELRLKEIKNGRLAMLAFAGFVAQAQTTGESPLDNLSAHLSDPWGQNVFARDIARL